MAEAHPVGFRWVMKAKERGATVIHVDPRFSRTSAMADLWVPIRAGGDIAFLGGLVRHVLEKELYFREYVAHFTNASVILKESFEDTEALDGLFSGWDPEKGAYDTASWQYEGDELDRPRRDPTLQHPRCVFQVLQRHYARYTPEMVERVAGVPPDLFRKVADALVAASGPERTAAICYAVGWTQHSKGVQIIRTAAILQLLLGNIGRPGGGILALRGHASIQGSTDIPTLYDILPGYLTMPQPGEDLDGYVERAGHRSGYWANLPSFIVSLLKAYYGKEATEENDFGFGRLPRITRNHSHFAFFAEMMDGKVDGLFVMGQNPAVGGQHSRFERAALSRLKWLVVRDLVEIETASFWYDSPEVARGELKPRDIDTEVFLFPAAGHAEKEGAFTQTQRMLQWREKAVDPPGDCRSEAWFIHQLALRLKAKAEASGDPRDEPLRALDWWYPADETGDPHMEAVLAEINGWRTLEGGAPPPPSPGGGTAPTGATLDAAAGGGGPSGHVHAVGRDGRPHHGPQVEDFAALKDDGSTACGCWIYSGVYGPDGHNKARSRDPHGPYGHGWGFAWPKDRRILYNRASARPDGRPWSERKKLVWWDEDAGRWTGNDVPDFPTDKEPGYEPPEGATGMDAHPGDAPFIMHDDGLGWLFVPTGPQGRAPAHALRAPGVARPKPPVRAADQPGREPHAPAGQPLRVVARPEVPLRAHHLPPHRAPHGGGDEPLPQPPGRAPADLLRRALPRARREGGGGQRRLDHPRHPQGRRGSAGAGDPAHPPPAGGRRAGDPPGGRALPLGHHGAHHRGQRQRPHPPLHGAQREHPRGEGAPVRRAARPPAQGSGAGGVARGAHRRRRRLPRSRHGGGKLGGARGGRRPRPPRHPGRGGLMAIGDGLKSTNQGLHHYARDGVTVGFFTDPTVCIGCKACEVACKEWNGVPADDLLWEGTSYDNTGALGASTWRHVKFLEQEGRMGAQVAGPMTGRDEDPFRWLFASDVCKHCEVAGCLEACPTGSIVRTETGGVYVQDDVCNGCGYCVVGCPFGVIDRRPDPLPGAGGAFKCTFCYDRQKSGLAPACAKACPTESIQFGPLDELRKRARRRLDVLQTQGWDDVALYDPTDTSVKGIHAFFLVPGDPSALGLPPRPEVPTAFQPKAWTSALLTSAAMLASALLAFAFL